MQITLYNNMTQKYYDISNVVSNLSIASYIEDQPTKVTFDILNDSGIKFAEGSTIQIISGSDNIFKGFLFKQKRNKDVKKISVTCYDQLRYLKNKDSYVFENMTSDQIFSKLCDDFVLKYLVKDKSSYICAPKTNDNVELYQMIKNALYDTLTNSSRWFIVRDNFGVLEHVNILSLQSGLKLGDASGITDIDYESSIDDDVYNQVKLYRDNKDTKKRDIFIVNDTVYGGNNLKAWGILQYYASVEEGLNLAQIEQRARGMLSLFDATKRTLKISALGYWKVFAGSIIRVQIADLGDMTLNANLVVTECTHKVENPGDDNGHTMELTTEVVKTL